MEGIERVAYELCQTQAEANVIYTEVHYPPHYFLPESFHRQTSNDSAAAVGSSNITIRDIVKAVNRFIIIYISFLISFSLIIIDTNW